MRHRLQQRWATILETDKPLRAADFLTLETCPVCNKYKDMPEQEIPVKALTHIKRHSEAPPTSQEEIERAKREDALYERNELADKIRHLNHSIRNHKYKRGKHLTKIVNHPDDPVISEIGDQYVNYHTRIISRLKQEREQLREKDPPYTKCSNPR